ncbi:hypothetical protein HYX00_03445 [Candidatus Woesearchaeota archaeon]|nr:hypothetical protein [Candidatus Woesearchaeota archaeon]
MIESQKAIEYYVSQLKLDEASVASNVLQQKNILGDEPSSISRNFYDIVKNFRLYLIYTFILLVMFVSINWTITTTLINKKNFNKLIKDFLKIFFASFSYLGLVFYFFYSLFNITTFETATMTAKILTKVVPFSIFSIILAYFMFISISLLHKTELKNIIQKTLSIGIKKAHYILSVYFLNVFLFGISIFLFYYFIEKNLFILLLSIMLMIFSFVFGRIFMVNVVEKLEKS